MFQVFIFSIEVLLLDDRVGSPYMVWRPRDRSCLTRFDPEEPEQKLSRTLVIGHIFTRHPLHSRFPMCTHVA